uniref:Uncharacterized protein n=2 Tax=Rhinopithecus TaxID=542827 RepID=A0A2K6ML15_RHIBE
VGHPSPGHLCPASPQDPGCCLFPTCPSPVPPVTWASCPSVSLVSWSCPFLLLTLGHTPSPPACEWWGAGVVPRTDSMGRRPSCQAVLAGHTPMPARPVPHPQGAPETLLPQRKAPRGAPVLQ